MRQPGPWVAPTDTGGVRGGTKTAESTGGILVTPGDSQSPKRLPWPIVMSNPRDHTGGTGLSKSLQCDSGQNGLRLAITNGVGQINCS